MSIKPSLRFVLHFPRHPDGGINGLYLYTFLFMTVVISGFYNILTDSWSPFFLLNLFLHPILGLVVAVQITQSIFARLRQRIEGMTTSLELTLIAMVFLALLRSHTLKYLPPKESNLIAGITFVLLTVLGLYFFWKAIPLIPKISKQRGAWNDIALISSWALSTILGLWILFDAITGRTGLMVLNFHQFVSYLASAIGLWALLSPIRTGIRRQEFQLGVLHAAVATILVALGTNQGYSLILQPAPPPPDVTVHLSAEPLGVRAPKHQDPFPQPVDAQWLLISKGCGGGECHDPMVEDVGQSLHTLSYRTPHLYKILDLLAEEAGEENQRVCAGCHAPAGLFAQAPTVGEFHEKDAMACTTCHSIADAGVEDGAHTWYTMRFNADHFRMFVRDDGADEPPTRWNQFLLQLNPKAHGKVFRSEIIGQDVLCVVCHAVQLRMKPDPAPVSRGKNTSGEERPDTQPPKRTCVACHMEPRKMLEMEGSFRSHIFTGANTTTYELLGMEDAARRNERWMQGGFLERSLLDTYVHELPPVRAEGDSRLPGFYYATVDASLDSPIRAGQPVKLKVTTKNIDSGHAFPASSLDLMQMWLEVRVTGSGGEILYSSGGVDKEQRLLPDSRFMGGYMADEHGKVIEHYRIWAAKEEVILRRLENKASAEDVFEFQLPVDASGWVNVDVQWRYRKINDDFWSWVYGRQRPIPAPVMLKAFRQFRIEE